MPPPIACNGHSAMKPSPPIITPMTASVEASARAELLGRYPSCWMALRTRARVCADIRRLMTRTRFDDSPASIANLSLLRDWSDSLHRIRVLSQSCCLPGRARWPDRTEPRHPERSRYLMFPARPITRFRPDASSPGAASTVLRDRITVRSNHTLLCAQSYGGIAGFLRRYPLRWSR